MSLSNSREAISQFGEGLRNTAPPADEAGPPATRATEISWPNCRWPGKQGLPVPGSSRRPASGVGHLRRCGGGLEPGTGSPYGPEAPAAPRQKAKAAPAEGDPSPLEAQPKRQRAPRKAASEPAIAIQM
eukprot:tig00000342_g24264.t1